MYKQNGISLILLIIIAVAIGAVICVGFQYAKEYMEKQQTEDIKVTMLTIQGVSTNIKNKHTVDEENNALVGTKLDLENNETEYKITEELKQSLLSNEEAELYILSQEELTNNGVKNVNITDTEFYIVDYNSEEVFYSLGVNGKYKLSELE